MKEGKLLGHIISKYGIKIDPDRVVAIQKIGIPRNTKEIQSFHGRVNIFRRFIPNFEIFLKTITNMLKKGNEIKWIVEARRSFDNIKRAIAEAPVLVGHDFSKYFLLFYFTSKHTIAGVLLQKYDDGFENPIAFLVEM